MLFHKNEVTGSCLFVTSLNIAYRMAGDSSIEMIFISMSPDIYIRDSGSF